MKNLIRSKEEQLRKQAAEIAKKNQEKALLEQFFSQTPKDFTSNSLQEVYSTVFINTYFVSYTFVFT